jgi:malonyl-CoA/methylmalonyl-CoA synthetase
MGADENLFTLFEQEFHKRPDATAFADPQGNALMSYGGLLEAAARYANALSVLGVAPGDRLTAQIEKSLSGVILYLAALKCGAVFHPLNPAYTLAEVEYFVSDAKPVVIVSDPATQMAMRDMGNRHGVTAVVNLAGDGHGSLSELAGRMEPRHQTIARNHDDLAGLLYTSGTTGRSKGAMITHGNLSSNALALRAIWEFGPSDRLIHALPVFHVHGLFVALNTAFLSGSELLWFEKFNAAALLDALPHATAMMGVPTFYTRLLAEDRLNRDVCRNMRLFISGSAPLLAETHQAFNARTGHAILERYGMTETGMITSNPYRGCRVAGTVGFSLPDVSIRISGNGKGEPGPIEVKGPNVFKGYWQMPEKTREDFTADGYFITGDIGTIDPEGRLAISGRAKDLIISGGLNVYPKEIESELDALSNVTESAVIGVPHPDFGEAVVAVVATPGPLASEDELISALGARLAKFKVPKRVISVPELPKNAMGKVQKAELRRQYADLFRRA